MRYVLARLTQGVFILFGVSIITFFLPNLYYSPITLAVAVLGHGHGITHESYVIWLKQNGLDGSIWNRYWHWLWQALHGNFGVAYKESTRFRTVTVSSVLGANLFRSVVLVFIPTVASVLIAIPIGLSQAVRRNRLYDHLMTTGVFILYSTPAVLVCTLLAYYFGDVLGIGKPTVIDTAQQVSPGQFPSFILHNFSSFELPFAAIIFLSIGGLTRYMRGSALDTLVQDYVRTARAKGASPTRVLFRHVFRPSVIPLVTIVGLTIPTIIGGALIIEEIFSYPGMGVLTVNSVQNDDFAVVMAITMFTAFLTVVGNLLADVFVAIADPRIRLGASR
jgi:peptide/nickel transport system permease protein